MVRGSNRWNLAVSGEHATSTLGTDQFQGGIDSFSDTHVSVLLCFLDCRIAPKGPGRPQIPDTGVCLVGTIPDRSVSGGPVDPCHVILRKAWPFAHCGSLVPGASVRLGRRGGDYLFAPDASHSAHLVVV